MKPDSIDTSKCTLCGLCTEQCRYGVLLINEKKKRLEIYDKNCLECSHCIAVCPERALSSNGEYPKPAEKFPPSQKTLTMLNKRRSVRKYLDKKVEREKLQELAEFARFAPTGSNTQGTHVLFVTNEQTRKKLINAFMKFYRKINALVSIWPIRLLFYLFIPKKKAREYRDSLKNMIKKHNLGEDALFHGSPVIMFVYYLKGGSSLPKDDACYALYNMVLGAESMGLGTCINGLAVIAYKTMKTKIRKILGLPKKGRIYTSSSLGYPYYDFKSTALRKPAQYKII